MTPPFRRPEPRDGQEFRQNFGAYLRQKREQAQMTMRQISQLVGTTNDHWSKMERGRCLPTRTTAEKIGEYFGETQIALLAAGYLPFVGWVPRAEFWEVSDE